MLIIMTNAGEYRTTESKEEIKKKVELNQGGELIFKTNEKTIELENGINECEAYQTLNLDKVIILGYKEFEIGNPVIQETELKVVRKKYSELGERLNVLETAFDTPEFNSILEDEKAIKERKLAYHEKLKQEAKK